MKKMVIEGAVWNEQIEVDPQGHFCIGKCIGEDKNYASVHGFDVPMFSYLEALKFQNGCESMHKLFGYKCKGSEQCDIEQTWNRIKDVAWYPDNGLDGDIAWVMQYNYLTDKTHFFGLEKKTFIRLQKWWQQGFKGTLVNLSLGKNTVLCEAGGPEWHDSIVFMQLEDKCVRAGEGIIPGNALVKMVIECD